MIERFEIVRDRREHEGKGWQFAESDACSGTTPGTLKQGDYAIAGHLDLIAIERKGPAFAELVGNLTQPRFEKCLARLHEHVEHPFVICEWDMADLAGWPRSAGLPLHTRAKIRTTPGFLFKRLAELMIKYPRVRWIWAGPGEGQRIALALFKAVWTVQEPTSRVPV